jgi:hypothetical protein
MMAPTSQSGGTSLVAEVERDAFVQILKQADKPLVLHVHSGFPKMHKYFTCYAGFCFMTKSKQGHDFTMGATVLPANKVTSPTPGMGL